MPECHQCKTEDLDDSRDGNCGICFAEDVTFCVTCAMWELGPKPVDEVDIFTDMKRNPEPLRLSSPRQHSSESKKSTGSVAKLPLECKSFFPPMAAVCRLAANQLDASVSPHPAKLYGENFKDYTCKVLDKFRELYPSCKYNRVAIQVLLFMYLSAQERIQCRKVADKEAKSELDNVEYLKRWQIRTLAVAHLRQHLGAIGTKFGGTVKALVGEKTWLDALALDDFEYYMKGFKAPTLMAIDLKQLAGSTEAARETLELAIILYHTLTATRAKSDLKKHWSQTRTNFTPQECLGMLSTAHYETLYGSGGDGTAFDDATKGRLNALWNALGDADLPSHPRFADSNVPTSLEQVEQDYLQYLPTFDHLESDEDERSECEQIVRKRVVELLGDYREAFAKDYHVKKVTVLLVKHESEGGMASTRTIKLEATDLDEVSLKFDKKTGESHIRTDLASEQQDKLDEFLRTIQSPAYLDARNDATFQIDVTYKTGASNPTSDKARKAATRRNTRRDLVLNPINALLEDENGFKVLKFSSDPEVVDAAGDIVEDWDREAFVDDVIARMQTDFYVDQCFGDGLAKLIFTGTNVMPMAWFPFKLKKKALEQVFPDCGYTRGEIDVLPEHYQEIGDGLSKRPEHYVDWRNHKDNWLYDCFHITLRRRPLFCSLSLQPMVPEANGNYGDHTMLFKRSTTRHRSVHNFGDKQQPRRSMLLLLDDLLYARPKKDGDEAQTPEARRPRVDYLLLRIEAQRLYGDASLDEQWAQTLKLPQFSYCGGDELIECQIFGPLSPTADVDGIVTIVEDSAWMGEYMPKNYCIETGARASTQRHLDDHYGGARLLAYQPRNHNPKFAIGKRESAKTIKNDAARQKLIEEEAKDHASTD